MATIPLITNVDPNALPSEFNTLINQVNGLTGSAVIYGFYPQNYVQAGDGGDYGLAINRAITAAAAGSTYSGQVVYITGALPIKTPIQMAWNVAIIGLGTTPFYNYQGSDTITNAPRIYAVSGFPTSSDLIVMPQPVASGVGDSNYGLLISRVILDAANIARYCVNQDYTSSSLQAVSSRIDDCLLVNATSHGWYANNVSVLRSSKSTIAQCNGFGLYCNYGVSDSEFTNLYVHACGNSVATTGGAWFFGSGCVLNKFIAGKFENNYGAETGQINAYPGSLVNTNQPAYLNTTIALIGGSFQQNNGVHLQVSGGCCTADNVDFVQGGWTNNASYVSDVYMTTNNGGVNSGAYFAANNCRFSGNLIGTSQTSPTANGSALIASGVGVIAHFIGCSFLPATGSYATGNKAIAVSSSAVATIASCDINGVNSSANNTTLTSGGATVAV